MGLIPTEHLEALFDVIDAIEGCENQGSVTCSSYPDGQLTIRCASPFITKFKKQQSDTGEIQIGERLYSHFTGAVNNYATHISPESRKLQDLIDREAPGYGGLPRGSEFNYRKKQKIRRVVGAIEREYPNAKNQRFITLTIPGSTEQARESALRWSSYASSRLDDFLKNLATRLGLERNCFALVKVYEMQRRKKQEVKDFIHWHLVLGTSDRYFLKKVDQEIKQAWVNILLDINRYESIRLGGIEVDVFKRHETLGGSWLSDTSKVKATSEMPRKSLSAYLCKYTSKAESKSKEVDKETGEVLTLAPTRWYTTNKVVRGLTKKYTRVWRSKGMINRRHLERCLEDIESVLSEFSFNGEVWREDDKNFSQIFISAFCNWRKQVGAGFDIFDWLVASFEQIKITNPIHKKLKHHSNKTARLSRTLQRELKRVIAQIRENNQDDPVAAVKYWNAQRIGKLIWDGLGWNQLSSAWARLDWDTDEDLIWYTEMSKLAYPKDH